MDVIVERQGALDVHKEQVTACVRVPDERGERISHVAEFKTTVRGLLVLRDWLKAHRVRQVTMEATGVYWKPVWYVLEDEFELVLVNARHVKQVPGRKTDVSDAMWLCQLAEAGLLRASFVPPKPIRQLRQLTRYRKAQVSERQRETNRLHKALEDTGIKLDCVATDILGRSGRAIGAVKHSIICACWNMLATGELYNDLGGDYFTRRDPERQTRRLVAQLERLGHHVTLQTAA